MRAFFQSLIRAIHRRCGRFRPAAHCGAPGSARVSRPRSPARRRVAVESLEARLALDGAAPSFLQIDDQNVASGAPLWLGIDGLDPDAGPLSYVVSVSNPSLLEATIGPSANSSLQMDVEGYGRMTFHLFDHLAPRTTQHIKSLVSAGEFNNTANLPVKWYRISHYGDNTEFVIQGGPQYPHGGFSSLGKFDDEYNLDLQFTSPGLLAMGKSLDDTNDASIFVSGSPARFLDFNHAIFGVLTEGETVRQAIQRSRTSGDGPPPSDIVITGSSIITDTQNAALMLRAAEGASGLSDVTLTVTDAQGNVYTQTFHVTVAPDTANSAPFLTSTPATISGPADTPLTFQLQALDVENNPYFFDATRPSGETVPYTLTVNNQTGQVTITPPTGFTGSFQIQVGVRGVTQATTADQFDTQIIEVVIGTPTFGVDLLSDTGLSATDNVTNASTLDFRVTGVTDGALVKLRAGDTILAQGTANGTSITLSTTQVPALGQGIHQITAAQTIEGVESDPTPPLSLTYDNFAPLFASAPPTAASVGVPLTYDAQTNEEGLLGFSYSLTGPFGGSIDPLTGVFSWIPSPDQTGLQDFLIAATDVAGNTAYQHLSFSVSDSNFPNNPPIAVDDTAFAYADLPPPGFFIINVLANDSTGPDAGETLTIVSVGTPASGGMAEIEWVGGSNIRYRPAPGFTGTDTFNYTISDGRGGTATATVSVRVHRPPTTTDQARVDFILRLTTPDGSPLTHLVPGQEFVLHVLTQDQSTPPQGVFAAYLDVAWDSSLAAVTGPIRYASAYFNGKSGDTTIPGLIDEGGAFSGSRDGTGSEIYEVFSVPMRASASGSLVFTSDPADHGIVHEVLVYGMNEPVPTANISYGAVSIDVGDALPLDVNADGFIAPSDVLLIVNAINAQIAAGIGDGSLPAALDSNRLDVNGDAHLTALDALIVINHINEPIVSSTTASQSTSSADAEGESPANLADEALLSIAADESWLDWAGPRRVRARR